jgi:hypothetical protein
MRAIPRAGAHLVFSTHLDKETLLVNLNARWTYQSSHLSHGRLLIVTGLGSIILAFSGPPPNLVFDHEVKDQLVFKVLT